MNAYLRILKIAEDLQEYTKEALTDFQAIDLAAKIYQCDILSRGLLQGDHEDRETHPLEAIAMVLGHEPENRKNKL